MDTLNTRLSITTGINVPLLVDLDGTLTYTDTLWEAIILYLKKNPLRIFMLLWWLRAGKAYFKEKVSAAAPIDVAVLPYRTDLLESLREQARLGRRILLVTGASRKIAQRVAEHVNVFDQVICSNERENLTGKAKAQAVARLLGSGRYLYAGDSWDDVPVFENADGLILAGAPAACVKRLQRSGKPILHVYPPLGRSFPVHLRAIRIYQWVKNLLIFVPLLLAHRFADFPTLVNAVGGFLAFSFTASATYVINDLFDLDADRNHSEKRSRAFASGRLSIVSGLMLSAGLLAAAAGISLLMPLQGALILACYCGTTLLYSGYLKRKLSLDVVVLAMFYTMRILYGGSITGILISIWTLGFSVFLFLCLALIKRVIELRANGPEYSTVSRRGYLASDVGQVGAQAAASGYLAVLVMVLYLNSPQVRALYRRPDILWAICPLLLYWVNRLLILANRGYLRADPIVFALTDRASLVVAVAVLATIWLAM